MSRAQWWFSALTAAAGAAGASCMLVDGDGDYKVGTIASDAGVPNMPVEASGPDVEAGPPHGDAGADVDAAASCSSSALNSSELMPAIQSCVLLRACFPVGASPISNTVSQCVTYDEPHRNAGLSCSTVTNAGCADMAQCFGNGFDFSSDCASNEISAKCVGNKAVICGVDSLAGVNEYYDCDISGGTCTVLDGDSGVPNYAGCVVVSSCSDPPQTTECSGTAYAYTCIAGKGFGQNCASRSETCETRASSACYFHDTPCGATLTTCDTATGVISVCANGYEDTYDCSNSGLGCALDSSNNGYCLAPGCTPTTQCSPSCDADGHTIHLCIGGAPLTVDCANFLYDPTTNTHFSSCLDFGTSSAPDPVCD
jgi:hypothetical protein